MHTVLNDHFVSRQHNGEGGVVSIFFSWSWAIHVHNFRLVVIFLRSIRLVFFFHVVIIRFNHDYRFPRSSTPSQRNIASRNALSALVPRLGFLFSRFCSPSLSAFRLTVVFGLEPGRNITVRLSSALSAGV